MWIYGVITIALGATLGVMAVTVALRPNTRPIALRGGLIALAPAVVIGLIVFGAVLLVGGNADDGLQAEVVAASYLLLNLVILAVGLWFKPSASWAVGAAFATPVILAAIGFGYVAFRSVPA